MAAMRVQTLDYTLFDYNQAGRGDLSSSQDCDQLSNRTKENSRLTRRMLEIAALLHSNKHVEFQITAVNPCVPSDLLVPPRARR